MSVQACAELVRKGDPDRFLSVMATPPEAREALFPIYAFNLEVARAPWAASEPSLAEMRVQWWVDVLDEIIAGQEPRPHEVSTPLGNVATPAIARTLSETAEARRLDCDPGNQLGGDALEPYLSASSGALYWAAGQAVGVGPDQEEPLREIGYAAGLANWLRAVAVLQARGRQPLAQLDDAALVEMAQHAGARLRQARRSITGNARWVSRAAWLADRTLRSAAANPASVRNGSLHNPEILRRGLLLWRVVSGRP